MKIYICNGYYAFYPENPMDITLANARGLDLVENNGHYTFAALKKIAPTYLLVGQNFAKVQYSGTPAEVMGANELVYMLETQQIVPAQSITKDSGLDNDGTRFLCVGIPQAGGMVTRLGRLKSCVVSWKPEGNACTVQGVELWT